MMELTATSSSFPEERLLLRELTHRISNEFASVVNIISFAAAKTESTEARSALTGVMDRLEGYVRVHRALQIPDAGDIVDATAYLRELCRSISLSKLERKNIDLVFAERPLSLRSEQCWILGMAADIPSLNKMLVTELARGEYVVRRENIIALGNSGTGKCHVALAPGLRGKRCLMAALRS